MEMLLVSGGHPLVGDVDISGSKNSSLPILVATLLCEGESQIKNVPDLADTKFLMSLIRSFGVQVEWEKDIVAFDGSSLKGFFAHYDVVRKMRASVLVLAPLLARFGQAKVSLPGGCAIGSRPVDIHLQGLEQMGAKIDVVDGYIHASLINNKFQGCEYTLPLPSVGATEQLIMAAVLAQGKTILHKVAKEPEIVELCAALISAGAKIKGAGTATVEIEGVDKLSAINYTIRPDRIEAGTFMAIAAATKSKITLNNIYVPDVANIMERFSRAGLKFITHETKKEGFFHVDIIPAQKLKAVDIETAAYPGFPTDMQAQFMAAMTLAEGDSVIYERIFENRMMHVPELCRMGAKIKIDKGVATVSGQKTLSAAPVMATDLRASASLVIAALAACGQSEIRRLYHLDRGYEALDLKLRKLGAKIERTKQD